MPRPFILSLIALVLTASASAQPATVYTDRAAFEAAAPGLPVETFDEATTAPNTIDEIAPPLNSTTDNGVFAPGDILPGMEVQTNPPSPICSDIEVAGAGIGGADSPRVGNAQLCDLFLFFEPNVTAVGLGIQALYGFEVNVDARDADGTLLGTFLIEDNGLNFLGFTSETPIAEIFIDSGISWDFVYVDYVAFGDPATASADVSVAVTSFTNDIERGESVFFRGPLSNNGGEAQEVYAFFEVEAPGGQTLRTNLGGITLDAGQTVNVRKFRKNRFHLPPDAPAGTYTVTLSVADGGKDGPVLDSDTFEFTLPPSSELTSASPSALAAAAGPNPFADRTRIRYTVEETAHVDLRVFDSLGREVAALVSGTRAPGVHTATLEADDLPGGVYVWRLAIGGEVTTGHVTLVR